MGAYILSVDQGTTATKSLLVDRQGRPSAISQRVLAQIYPRPGWVEMDPALIWESIIETGAQVLDSGEIEAIGLANQGETVIAWDRETGDPLYNAITWQCTRTEERCQALAGEIGQDMIRAKTGLVLDPYFSATKMQWLLENVPAVQAALKRGALRMGTLDSWMIWRMTGGKRFVTDYSTASRTMLFNVHELDWDQELLSLFNVPRWALADPVPSATVFGETDPAHYLGLRAPITGSAVDQPAALFGHNCIQRGDAKITYGTGAFLLTNIGKRFSLSQHGLLTSVAATVEGEEVQYYLDGGVYCVGAAIQWLQESLGLIASPQETGEMAASLPDNGDVYFVPALVGLAAPHWDRAVRGAFFGLTPAATRAHLVRAVLEAIAFRVLQVVRAMEEDMNRRIERLRVDGGVARNDFLMRYQADLLGIPLERRVVGEMTALGAARLAGQSTGFWCHDDPLPAAQCDVFSPSEDNAEALASFERWREAVKLTRAFG